MIGKGITKPAGVGAGSGAKADLWSDAKSEFTRRVTFMAAYGETGTGRTRLALTAPGPIALIHAGEKIEGIVQNAIVESGGDKVIRLHDFSGTFGGGEDQIKKAALEKLEGMKSAVRDAMSWAKTVVIDTHTYLYELIRIARFGRSANIMPHHYGPIYAEFRGIFAPFRRQEELNVIAIGMIRERYVNDKPTGKMEQAGMKEMNNMPDVIIATDKVRDRKSGETTFKAVIEKAWWNAAVEGMELENDDVNFANIMAMVTETDEAEWQEGR